MAAQRIFCLWVFFETVQIGLIKFVECDRHTQRPMQEEPIK
jgi:hypothetical protein